MANERYLDAINHYLKLEAGIDPSDVGHYSDVHSLSDDETINALCELKYEQKIARDQKQGITSRLISIADEEGNKKLLFLRDARQINEEKIDETYNFTGIGLNYLIAAKRMIDDSKNAAEIDINFLTLADQLIYKIHENPYDDLAQVISDFLAKNIEPALRKVLPDNKNIRGSLEKWAAWSSLEMATPAVSTIHSLKKNDQEETFIQLDVPQTKLTEEIKNEWEYALDNHEINKDTFNWFDHGLTLEEKKIARHYAPLILRGDRNGSAQLRNKIPGLKNAYEQLTLKYDEAFLSFIILNQIYHSATVVYLPNVKKVNQEQVSSQQIEDEKLRLTILGLKQQQFNADNLPMHYFTLNSKEVDKILGFFDKNYYGVDTDIVTFSQLAAKKIMEEENNNGIFVSNFCLNEFRIFFSDDRPGIQSLEDHIQKFNKCLSENIDEIKKDENLNHCVQLFKGYYHQYFGYSDKGTDFEKIEAKMSNTLRIAADISDRNVRNLEEVTLISLLLSLKNRILDMNQNFDPPKFKYNREKTALYVGCASGDNRTGILLTHTEAVSMGIANDTQLMRKFTRAGHIQENCGNTLCTCGIRPKSKGAFRGDYDSDVIENLVSQRGAADLKSLPEPNPFIELEETIKKERKSPLSLEYTDALCSYYNELKAKDIEYTNKLKNFEINNNENEKTTKLDITTLNKNKIKISNERRDLRILAGNFNKVLNTMRSEDDNEKKRVITKFNETVPKASRTVKFCKYISLALSLMIVPPLCVFLMYKFDKLEYKEKERNHRIAGDFKMVVKKFNDEYHRQKSILK